MALTNAQYDNIMRIYDKRQFQNRRLLSERRREVYTKAPKLTDIDNQVSSLSIEEALKTEPSDDTLYKAKITALHEARGAILESLGYSKDYLEPVYDCPDCRDTGFIGSEKCHCFKQLAIDLLYENSNIESLIEDGDFDKFDLKYYSKEETDAITGISSYDSAKRTLDSCRSFVHNFSADKKNLYIYGDVGMGKTLLTHCIAKALLAEGYSVLYYTSAEFFEVLSSHTFGKDDEEPEKYTQIYDCDLLVIDDLGTELTNKFVISGMFECINGRALSEKSTIFSTNLTLEDTQERYGDRIFSRLVSSYDVLRLFGQDVRLARRMENI